MLQSVWFNLLKWLSWIVFSDQNCAEASLACHNLAFYYFSPVLILDYNAPLILFLNEILYSLLLEVSWSLAYTVYYSPTKITSGSSYLYCMVLSFTLWGSIYFPVLKNFCVSVYPNTASLSLPNWNYLGFFLFLSTLQCYPSIMGVHVISFTQGFVFHCCYRLFSIYF